ncbi:MAG TPA: OsmC family protein [Pirellulales bacterium]|jgi:osmotically inducible protein OsmC|nr:OsmC family protein [Pirellulales bacterium]
MPISTSSAFWEKDLMSGHGTMTVGNDAYRGPYSFKSRFEKGSGTNPEELLAAAHAGCFSMAFSHALSQAGHVPDRVQTTAKVHLDKVEGGFAITKVELVTEGKVPGMDQAAFQKTAEEAKKNCPVSKLFAGAQISLTATLSK